MCLDYKISIGDRVDFRQWNGKMLSGKVCEVLKSSVKVSVDRKQFRQIVDKRRIEAVHPLGS